MAQMTKAQVLDENRRLRDACEDLERQLAEVRDAHQTMVAHRNKLIAEREAQYRYDTEQPDPTDVEEMRQEQAAQGQVAGHVPHASYWDYVKARKQLARARGWRIATYKPRAEWEAAVAAYHAGAH